MLSPFRTLNTLVGYSLERLLSTRKRPGGSLRGRDCHFPKLDGAVVALEQDGTGGGFIAINGAAGDSGDRLAHDDFFSVERDGHEAADEGGVPRLPFRGGR